MVQIRDSMFVSAICNLARNEIQLDRTILARAVISFIKKVFCKVFQTTIK
jgi:hypothetical protein